MTSPTGLNSISERMSTMILHTRLSATFEVGGASAGIGGEIDYFLIGILHKMY